MGTPVTAGPILSRHFTVETPEHVMLELELAGLGSRAAAAALDLVVLIIAGVVIAFVAAVAVVRNSFVEAWLTATLIAASFLLFWGYFVLFEALDNGRTPGKRVLGIRVVMETGHRVTFGAAAVRNLLRLADAQPGLSYFVGGLFVFFDSRCRRLGDLVAGTVVVRDRPEDERITAPPVVSEETVATIFGAPELADDEFRFLEQYLARRDFLEPEARRRLGDELVGRLAPRYPNRPRGEVMFLRWLHAEEVERRRALGRSSNVVPGSGAVASRFVATRGKAWNEFHDLATRVERRGLQSVDPSSIPAFAAAYREVAADLARARTYLVDTRVIAYLERLVSAGHNALYGLRGVRRLSLGRLLLGELPAAVVRARVYVLAAFLIFAVPSIVGYALVRGRPDIAAQVLPDGMISRAVSGAADRDKGVGYGESPSMFLPVVASSIIANNVQVAFMAFGLGISAGIGTVVVLAFNGLFLGAVLALFANYGVAGWLLVFVSAHGVLELPAIFISGGAGLLVARALVAPGDLRRTDALVVHGRTAIRMVGASASLLLLAGLIEGFLSASDAPQGFRLAITIGGAVLLVLYLAAGREYLNRPAE